MNKQEVFDKVATHLLKQGEKAMVNNMCKYKTEDGRMCAVGCLIADDYYDSDLEGISLWDDLNSPYDALVEAIENSIGTLEEGTLPLLKNLQQLHDSSAITPDDWPTKLKKIAAKHALSAQVVTND